MQKIFRFGATVAAAAFMLAGTALAQTPDVTPAPAPAAAPAPESAAPAPAPAAPAAAPAATPATSAPAAAATPAADAPAKTASEPHVKKSSHRRASRNAEIDRSINNGTVPARYRNSVPREYQQYIPFDRR